MAWSAPAEAPPPAAPLQQEPVLLYFATSDGRSLKSEPVILPTHGTPQETGRAIIDALVKGPKDPSLSATLPADILVKGFYITPDRTAVVDLDNIARERFPGSIMAETLGVFSIVNALVLNDSGIERVKLLFNGQETKTFAGHIDLESPLKANILLVR